MTNRDPEAWSKLKCLPLRFDIQLGMGDIVLHKHVSSKQEPGCKDISKANSVIAHAIARVRVSESVTGPA